MGEGETRGACLPAAAGRGRGEQGDNVRHALPACRLYVVP